MAVFSEVINFFRAGSRYLHRGPAATFAVVNDYTRQNVSQLVLERSHLAQRGHGKEGRKASCNIGVALLVTVDFRLLPLLHRTFPGTETRGFRSRCAVRGDRAPDRMLFQIVPCPYAPQVRMEAAVSGRWLLGRGDRKVPLPVGAGVFLPPLPVCRELTESGGLDFPVHKSTWRLCPLAPPDRRLEFAAPGDTDVAAYSE